MCGALGAARARASDKILPAVGVQLHVKVGQPIEEGQLWVELKHECQTVPSDQLEKLRNAIKISSEAPVTTRSSRILEIIE